MSHHGFVFTFATLALSLLACSKSPPPEPAPVTIAAEVEEQEAPPPPAKVAPEAIEDPLGRLDEAKSPPVAQAGPPPSAGSLAEGTPPRDEAPRAPGAGPAAPLAASDSFEGPGAVSHDPVDHGAGEAMNEPDSPTNDPYAEPKEGAPGAEADESEPVDEEDPNLAGASLKTPDDLSPVPDVDPDAETAPGPQALWEGAGRDGGLAETTAEVMHFERKSSPHLELSANFERETALSPGWPMLIELALEHPDATAKRPRPPIAIANLKAALRLRLADPDGKPVALQAQLVRSPGAKLLLKAKADPLKVVWFVAGADTAALRAGHHQLELVLDTSRAKRGWKGEVTSERVLLTVREPSAVDSWVEKRLAVAARIHLAGAGPTPLPQLEAFLQTHPKSYPVWLQQAELLTATERYREALVSFRRALALHPSGHPDLRKRTHEPTEPLEARIEKVASLLEKASR
jgi:hypothetical protein